MNDLLKFDNLITPKIITLVYWLLLLLVVCTGLGSMMLGSYGGFSIGRFLMSLLYIAVGALGVRIWCELLIVLFKMNDALQEIRRK